MLKTHKITNRQ